MPSSSTSPAWNTSATRRYPGLPGRNRTSLNLGRVPSKTSEASQSGVEPTYGFDIGVTWHTDADDARDTVKKIADVGRGAELERLDLA